MYLRGLDGIRAFAVTAVVWHHSHSGYSFLPMTRNGFLGVDVFFVLSGFLITYLLLKEQATTGNVSLKNFYFRRTLRIFPLYYAVLAALSLYYYLPGNSEFFARLPFDLTYTSNWTTERSIMDITWSLSTEEQFYLLWPPLFGLFGGYAVAFLLVFLAGNQLLNFQLIPGIEYGDYEILQCTFTPIVLGALLAHYMLRPRYRISEGMTATALVAMIVLANIANLQGWPRLAFHIASALAIGGVVMNKDMWLVRALEWKPLAHVGVVSYGVYLLHKIGIDFAARLMNKAGLESEDGMFIGAMIVTIALASVSYKFFERPILSLKGRFRGETAERDMRGRVEG
jgi:peptidoglycan/LPS O-acetylase OafA/YrhL